MYVYFNPELHHVLQTRGMKVWGGVFLHNVALSGENWTHAPILIQSSGELRRTFFFGRVQFLCSGSVLGETFVIETPHRSSEQVAFIVWWPWTSWAVLLFC